MCGYGMVFYDIVTICTGTGMGSADRHWWDFGRRIWDVIERAYFYLPISFHFLIRFRFVHVTSVFPFVSNLCL
jgi:hypothetical protein